VQKREFKLTDLMTPVYSEFKWCTKWFKCFKEGWPIFQSCNIYYGNESDWMRVHIQTLIFVIFMLHWLFIYTYLEVPQDFIYPVKTVLWYCMYLAGWS